MTTRHLVLRRSTEANGWSIESLLHAALRFLLRQLLFASSSRPNAGVVRNGANGGRTRRKTPLSIAQAVGILVLLVGLLTTQAARGRIIDLPFVEKLDSANSINDIAWATAGGTVKWEANGGWRKSGGVKVTAPYIDGNQGYAGLGSFWVGKQMRLNVRFLIYFGSSFQEQLQTDKLLIILREENGVRLGSLRPMIIDRSRADWGREHRYWRPCRGIVECGDVGPDKFTVSGKNNANQWVCFELESDLVAERINLYIHTEDGKHKGLASTVSLARERDEVASLNNGIVRPPTDFPIVEVQILGGYWNWSNGRDGGVTGKRRDANAYIKLDEVAIDTKYIGCPAGYLPN